MTWLRFSSKALGGSSSFHCLSTDSLPMYGVAAVVDLLVGLQVGEAVVALVAHGHVEDHAGHVALVRVARLEGVGVRRGCRRRW